MRYGNGEKTEFDPPTKFIAKVAGIHDFRKKIICLLPWPIKQVQVGGYKT